MPYVALIMAVGVRKMKKCSTDVAAAVGQDTAVRQPRAWTHPLPGASETKDLHPDIHGDSNTPGPTVTTPWGVFKTTLRLGIRLKPATFYHFQARRDGWRQLFQPQGTQASPSAICLWVTPEPPGRQPGGCSLATLDL